MLVKTIPLEGKFSKTSILFSASFEICNVKIRSKSTVSATERRILELTLKTKLKEDVCIVIRYYTHVST